MNLSTELNTNLNEINLLTTIEKYNTSKEEVLKRIEEIVNLVDNHVMDNNIDFQLEFPTEQNYGFYDKDIAILENSVKLKYVYIDYHDERQEDGSFNQAYYLNIPKEIILGSDKEVIDYFMLLNDALLIGRTEKEINSIRNLTKLITQYEGYPFNFTESQLSSLKEVKKIIDFILIENS